MGADSNKLTPSSKVSKTISNCRICGHKGLIPYLDLGKLPLANNVEDTQEKAISMERYPLVVTFCDNCKLSALSEVVDPRVLFSHYVYRSGMSKTYIQHCREMAKTCKSNSYLSVGSSADFIVDIAGNDGTLLKQFKEEMPGLNVLNIDPAKNLCKIARKDGIESWDLFLNINTAMQILKTFGEAAVITATNVFAHVGNVREFILSCKLFLQHNGVLILEFPYLCKTVEGNSFGQVYFEHLSYLMVTPLMKLCEETGMKIIDVEEFDIHDGTIRVSITHDYSNREISPRVDTILSKEHRDGYTSLGRYHMWNNEVVSLISQLTDTIKNLKAQGKSIAGFGASAKGNTLLNACRLTHTEIDYIVDDTPEKQGKFSPGTGIPILPVDELTKNPPDYLLILAWNFEAEIKQRVANIYSNAFIVPVPQVSFS